ncbi:MAG: winged helix-turn-helix domain-containing protein [bacterium]
METSTDYRPALLWLMAKLEKARTADAVAEFGQRLGDLIPAEHQNLNKSGSVKWENYVRWARQALVAAGLMGSGGHGVWTITEAGRKWLRDHPDGAKHKLSELVQGKKTAPGERSRPAGLSRGAFYRTILERLEGKLPGGIHNRSYNPDVNYLRLTHPAPRAQYEITLHKSVTYVGLVFYGSGDENRARLAPFQEALPQLEAELERSVETHVGGKSYSAVRLHVPPARLDPATARQLADTWLDFIEATLPILERVVPAQESGSGGLGRDAFYRIILERLRGKLPGGIHNRSYNPDVNYLVLNHPAPRTFYMILLRKSVTYLGLVFEGPGDENRARLAPFEEALPQLQAKLGRSVETHVGGESSSTVRLRLPPARLDPATARQLADTWLDFIEATLPILERVVAEFGLLVTTSEPPDTVLERPKTILAREIRNIRAYLDGDQSLSPSDEKLCSWIQFCYTFELFNEGAALFKLVRGDAVNPWLYERAQKLARACELRVDR